MNEKNVVSDRKAILSGADLYLNSKFVRSIIPASRFPGITRGRDVTEDGGESLEYIDDVMIDSVVEEIFAKATDAEKEYFIENIDDISIEFDMLIEYESTNDGADYIIKQAKELNAAQDELYNSLQLNEVAIEEETNRSGSGLTINPKKYRAFNKYNRYRNTNERVAKAWELANYFLMNGDIEEVENIAEMFGAGIDLNKLKTLNIQKSETRSGIKNSAFKSELDYALNWFKSDNGAKNGDVVSRGMEKIGPYGNYDHTGMFNSQRFIDGGKNSRARCMLASYPDGFQPISEERKPQRVEYASYEPLANFIDVFRVVVNRIPGKGDIAMQKAIDKYYGKNGDKSNYHKWCAGTYTRLYSNLASVNGIQTIQWSFTTYSYNCVTETLRWTDQSTNDPENVNYCSYIPWYAYKYGAGINLDSDYYSRKSTGNMKVPDDIVNSMHDQYAYCWVSVKKNGACGEYTEWSYVNKKVYSSKSVMVFINGLDCLTIDIR